MAKIKYILLTFLLIICLDVYAKEYYIEDSTELNYNVDLRLPYEDSIFNRTTIQDGIITSTCSYLNNSTGCGIQIPLTENLVIPKGKEVSITIVVASNNNYVPQRSTWPYNVNVMNYYQGYTRDGVWLLRSWSTQSENPAIRWLYNASVKIDKYGYSGNQILYSITYTFTPTENVNTKVLNLVHGMNIDDNYVTTGYFSVSSLLVDATNQEIVDAVKQTNQKLDELNKNITSSDVPSKNDLSAKLDTTGWLKPGPVDSIINMPLNLINNLLSSLNNNTCSQLVIDIPFLKDKQLIIPCISTIFEKMGFTDLFNSIGAVASAMILFKYLVGFYKWVDDTLSFREQNWGDF